METRLDLLSPGQRATVKAIDVPAGLKERLQDYGLIPGTAICCRYESPWGDVKALEFRGAVIALRTRDLPGIRVCRG